VLIERWIVCVKGSGVASGTGWLVGGEVRFVIYVHTNATAMEGQVKWLWSEFIAPRSGSGEGESREGCLHKKPKQMWKNKGMLIDFFYTT